MVDCRLCKHSYKIWYSETEEDNFDDKYKIVCMAKEVFIDEEYITEGPCDLYVDVDGHIPRDGCL